MPLGFEKQLRKGANFDMVLNEIDQELTKFDPMEGVNAIQDSIPFQKSGSTKIFENLDIPCISKKPTCHTPLFSSNCDFPLILIILVLEKLPYLMSQIM